MKKVSNILAMTTVATCMLLGYGFLLFAMLVPLAGLTVEHLMMGGVYWVTFFVGIGLLAFGLHKPDSPSEDGGTEDQSE